MSGETGGPYVQVAVLCEKVLQEKDGAVSIIRIVDRFTVMVAGPAAPDEMPPGTIHTNLVVTLKSGFLKGRQNLRIVPTTPSGKRLSELSTGVLLEGDDRGVNAIFDLRLPVNEEGLYWFDVQLDEQLLTRIPLRLVYQRVVQGRLFEPPQKSD